MTLTLISGIAAFVLYTVASLIVFSQFRGQTQPSRQSILLPGSLALIAHGISLWSNMVTPSGLHLGLFNVASTV
ncbi:MAG: cytochrome C assembly protein, partial [Anaerolineae bacterium]|nr:cytochrome C assembly protein [Anaerolineae bacterium]